MSFFITNALADTANVASSSPTSNILSFLPLAALVVIFYFFLIRPQAKRAREQRDLINNLAKGDEVITSGGLLGKISRLSDDFLTLEIANNIEIKVQKNAITNLLPKGTLKAN